MKKGMLLLCLMVMAACAFCVQNTFAQAMEEEDGMFAIGNVKTVTSSEIVLEEYDFETDLAAENTYILDEETVFDNFDSLDELVVDDEVGLSYYEKDGQNVVDSIYKYGEEAETEEMMMEEPAADDMMMEQDK